MNRLPRWRIACALLILAGLLFFLAMFAPYYFRNYELQSYVSDVTQRVENQSKSDDALSSAVAEKARQLGLPVTADEVHVTHPASGLRIDVRYFVRIDFPGYTVNLHFYPGAGSR